MQVTERDYGKALACGPCGTSSCTVLAKAHGPHACTTLCRIGICPSGSRSFVLADGTEITRETGAGAHAATPSRTSDCLAQESSEDF